MACNDSDAFVMMGSVHHQGTKEIKQDLGKAVALWEKAVELGSDLAHYYLGVAYMNGHGVEEDDKKALYHYRLAAISGNLFARYNLGVLARKSNQGGLAIKHWVIGANAEHDGSSAAIKKCYKHGYVDKDVFAKALRAHKLVSDEINSLERVAAAKERVELGIWGRL